MAIGLISRRHDVGVFERRQHRDIPDPEEVRAVVYPGETGVPGAAGLEVLP